MPIVRIRFNGKIHTRTVTRNFRGWYMMYSKGKEYRFVKDEFIEDNCGWHLIGENKIDETFLQQIAPQLEELYKLGR